MGNGLKDQIRMPNLNQFKSFLGWFALVFGFGLIDKQIGMDPFFGVGVTTVAMTSIVIRGSRDTQLMDLIGCTFGFAVLDLVAGWTRPLLGVQIITISVVSVVVLWRRWAEIPENAQET